MFLPFKAPLLVLAIVLVHLLLLRRGVHVLREFPLVLVLLLLTLTFRSQLLLLVLLLLLLLRVTLLLLLIRSYSSPASQLPPGNPKGKARPPTVLVFVRIGVSPHSPIYICYRIPKAYLIPGRGYLLLTR